MVEQWLVQRARGMEMKRILLAVAFTASGWGAFSQESASATTNSSSNASAAPSAIHSGMTETAHRFGAGLILGEPTGASLKYFLTETMAVDAAIGWGFHHETDLYVHGDFLWHKSDLFSVPEGRLSLYCGVGARVKLREGEDRFGVRLPVGVSYMFEDTPVDIFAEVGPVLDFTPSVQGGFTAGIGARIWF